MTDTANADGPESIEPTYLPLVGIAEIGDLLVRISRESVLRLTFRTDFPEPFAELAEGDVWCRDDVVSWIDGHRDAVGAMFVVRPPQAGEST